MNLMDVREEITQSSEVCSHIYSFYSLKRLYLKNFCIKSSPNVQISIYKYTSLRPFKNSTKFTLKGNLLRKFCKSFNSSDSQEKATKEKTANFAVVVDFSLPLCILLIYPFYYDNEWVRIWKYKRKRSFTR